MPRHQATCRIFSMSRLFLWPQIYLNCSALFLLLLDTVANKVFCPPHWESTFSHLKMEKLSDFQCSPKFRLVNPALPGFVADHIAGKLSPWNLSVMKFPWAVYPQLAYTLAHCVTCFRPLSFIEKGANLAVHRFSQVCGSLSRQWVPVILFSARLLWSFTG